MLTLCAVLTSLQASPLTYPADAYSRPLHDSQRVFETLVGCAPEGDVAFRAAHYLRDDLRLADDAGRPVAQWILQPRDGTSATMGIDFDIHRAATAVSFEAENRSAQALTLGLFLQELPWPAGRDSRGLGWVLGPPQPLAPGERRRLVFPFSEASSPGHPEVTQPQFPLVRGVLTIVGLGAGPGHRAAPLAPRRRVPARRRCRGQQARRSARSRARPPIGRRGRGRGHRRASGRHRVPCGAPCAVARAPHRR